jgi:hypothetical protein
MVDRDLTAVLQLVEQLQRALGRGDRRTLKEVIARLIALRAPMGSQMLSLAQIAVQIGELSLSRAALDLFVEGSGRSDAARYQQAAALAEAGALQEADAVLRTLPETVPDPVSNAYSRGVTALRLGDTDAARRYLEQVTRARPDAGSAWLSLAMAVDLAQEAELAARLVAAETAAERAEPAQRAAYYYALGKAHADRGEHAAAFAAYARGAELMRAVARYDGEQDRREAAQAIDGYHAERIAAVASRQDEPTGRTIFVTGLPRSGTTLVEQILTSHSAVGDGAEFGGLGLLAMDVGGRSWAALQRYVEVEGTASAARLWEHWLDERFAMEERIVDKSVDTSRFLGLAAALFPDAPLIWTTRDPLDRAWSCFRTNFMGGAIAWSYDQEDIAAHFRLEDALLARWQEILGDRLLVVPHEALVTDPENWIRRILAHCGLPEEPQVFAPHETTRAVATASMVQVRRPINREGVGSAAPYREFLQPFIAAYYG